MGQISLYCCFLFIQHQSVLDQAELKMRGKKSGHSRCRRELRAQKGAIIL